MLLDLVKYVAKRIVWSVDGLVATFKSEESFRLWLGFVILSDLAALITLNSHYTVIICLLGTLVLCLELVNTAIENTVDLITEEAHPLAKIAKDASSAAVALSGAMLMATWLFFLVQLV